MSITNTTRSCLRMSGIIHYELILQADHEGAFPDPQDLFERLDVILRADVEAEEVEDPHQDVTSIFKDPYHLEDVAPEEHFLIE